MNYHFKCNTTYFIVLLGIKDSNHIWFFVTESLKPYGIIKETSALMFINEQILKTCESLFDNDSLDIYKSITVINTFSEKIILQNEIDATLYLALIDNPIIFSQIKLKPHYQLIKFPEILKSMPKSKLRLAYLKAWQIILGIDKENIKAITSKYLKFF